MKRNWDLLRWLLAQAESAKAGCPLILTNGAMYGGPHYTLQIGHYDFSEVYEHILLLSDAGLAEVRSLGQTQAGPSGAIIDRLTMAGHDFLDAARNETLWKKAMQLVQDKGSGVTVGVLTQILSALVKGNFGLS